MKGSVRAVSLLSIAAAAARNEIRKKGVLVLTGESNSRRPLMYDMSERRYNIVASEAKRWII